MPESVLLWPGMWVVLGPPLVLLLNSDEMMSLKLMFFVEPRVTLFFHSEALRILDARALGLPHTVLRTLWVIQSVYELLQLFPLMVIVIMHPGPLLGVK